MKTLYDAVHLFLENLIDLKKFNLFKLLPTVLFLFTSPLFAQEIVAPDYIVRHFTDDNGLPQNSIKGLFKDENGFVWMTTEDGIARFDGQTFKIFNKANLATSTNRFGHFITFYGDDKLYTENGDGKFFFIRDGKVFPAVEREFHTESAYWIEGVWDTDRKYMNLNVNYASVYISSTPGSYYRCFRDKVIFNLAGKSKRSIPVKISDFWGLFSMDNDVYYHDKTGVFLRFLENKTEPVILSGQILHDPLWTGQRTSFDILWNKIEGSTVCLRLGNSLYQAKKMADGRLETSLLLKKFDFKINQIVSILFDPQNETLWLGSKNNGLFVFSPKLFKSVNSSSPLQTNEVYYAQAAITDSTVYTPQGNILGANTSGARVFSPFKDVPPSKYALLRDQEGYLWMEANDQLIKVDSKFNAKGKWQVFDEVTTLFEGLEGWIYAGRREKGLIRINKNAPVGSLEFVTNSIKNISYLSQLSSEMLLVGTAKGLYKYNLKSKKATSIPGLENKFVRSLYCPKPYDKIWVTTYGDGIFLLANGRLTRFPVDKDNYLATSHCMIEDDFGFFWITTNKGLFQASKQDLISYSEKKLRNVYYAYYSREDGFNSNEFNGGCQPCAVRLANGTISLPSMNGLVFFSPKDILSSPNNTKIFIDELKVDEARVGVTETLKLPHNFILLKAYISSPYLQNRKNVQLQYSLSDGSGKTLWFPVNQEGIISISNLRTGEYALQVRKSKGFGAKTFMVKTIRITVLPAWFETWLARCVFLLCFAGLMFIFVKWRNYNLIKQNRILESRIDAKTDALKVTLENLQASQNNLLHQVFLYERLVGSISHDIRTPLIFLNRSSEYLFNQLKGTKDPNSDLINIGKKNWEFSGRLLNLTDNLLEFIKSWLKKENAESEEINLFDLAQEKIEIFLPIAGDKNTVISNNIGNSLIVISQPGMISVIFYNLLDNAVKATKNGTIVISDEFVNDRLHISIRDSGLGMDPETVEWVNNSGLEKGHPLAKPPVQSGIGLVITIELAAVIGTKISAELNDTGGTTMMMIFPETENQNLSGQITPPARHLHQD